MIFSTHALIRLGDRRKAVRGVGGPWDSSVDLAAVVSIRRDALPVNPSHFRLALKLGEAIIRRWTYWGWAWRVSIRR